MKKLILFIALCFFTASSFAQAEIKTLTAKQVYDLIQQSNKPSIVEFWVPNCSNNVEIVKEYKKVVEKYGNEIDFYLMGITAKPELVQELIDKTGFNYPLYIINVAQQINLMEKRTVFEQQFLSLFKKKHRQFIRVYITKDHKVLKINKALDIDEKTLGRLLE